MNAKEALEITGRRLAVSNRLIVQEVLNRGGKVEKLPNKRFRLRSDKKSYLIRGGVVSNSFNTKLAKRCTDLKEVTSRLLRSKGYPSPENAVFSSTDIERAWNWAKPILPVVIKPNATMMGKLVFVKISDYEEFKQCFEKIAENYKEILIEQFIEGEEYRFTFVKNQVVGVANRIPANVIGDGINNIEKLVELKNKERKRRRNPIHKKLVIDDETIRVLDRAGFTLKDVPKDGERVFLRNNSNVSTSGDAIDVTDTIDEKIKETVAAAALSIPGLRVCGMDIIINDDTFNILEINANAMLSMHHYPWVGKPRDVVGHLVDAMFPDLIRE